MFTKALYFYRFPQELVNLNSITIQMLSIADESRPSQELSFVCESRDSEALDSLPLGIRFLKLVLMADKANWNKQGHIHFVQMVLNYSSYYISVISPLLKSIHNFVSFIKWCRNICIIIVVNGKISSGKSQKFVSGWNTYSVSET